MRNGNFLKMRVSEIRVNQIRVNQGLGVPQTWLRVGNSGTTIQHPKKWVVGSKIWHLRKSVKTKFVGIKRLDWNYFMLFFDISKFLDPPLTFLDVVLLFLNCPLLITSGVFLNNFFLIITSNLEPWSDSFVTFYDLAL